MATGDFSLGNDVGCLLRGTGPLSLRKDRVSLGASILTGNPGLQLFLLAFELAMFEL